jgi:hypothetical protein
MFLPTPSPEGKSLAFDGLMVFTAFFRMTQDECRDFL